MFLAIGVFDGVHRGHRRVLERCLALAEEARGSAWILTFDRHPERVLRPAAAPALLTSTAHKLRLVAAMGIHGAAVIPFTRRFANQPPEAFVRQLRRAVPSLRTILVGSGWRFGKRGRGNVAMLRRMGKAMGFGVEALSPARWQGAAISSTRIRKAVTRGRLREAEQMLGRPFGMLGTVVKGKGLGHRIGFPTANIDPHNEVWPPFGIYAVTARFAGRSMPAVVNIGVCPTVAPPGTAKPSIELHIPGFKGNLYGRDVEVVFAARLRAEKKFSGIEPLRRQIARDIKRAKATLGRLGKADTR